MEVDQTMEVDRIGIADHVGDSRMTTSGIVNLDPEEWDQVVRAITTLATLETRIVIMVMAEENMAHPMAVAITWATAHTTIVDRMEAATGHHTEARGTCTTAIMKASIVAKDTEVTWDTQAIWAAQIMGIPKAAEGTMMRTHILVLRT